VACQRENLTYLPLAGNLLTEFMQILRDNYLLAFEVCLIYFFYDFYLEILGRSIRFPVNPVMDFISSTDILIQVMFYRPVSLTLFINKF